MTFKSTTLRTLVPAAILAFALPAYSQNPADGQPVVVFHVDVVSKTIKAINYHHRQGSTHVGLEGTSFVPKAKGEVKVDSKTGATKLDAYVDKLPAASTLSDGLLTYVMWAITPEGRPENLGELMLDGDHARLQAATELQSFGIIVTAEPYYAVTQPSDYVIMEGVVKKDGGTTGTIMPIDAKYELVTRGGYLQYLPPGDRVTLAEARNKIPLDLMEARQAMAVAKSAGALRYAADTMQKAQVDLSNAEAFLKSDGGEKRIQTLARHVTQLAEDARLISVKKARQESLQVERAEAERRANALSQTAANEAERRRQAEADARRKAEEAAEANARTLNAQQQAAEAERVRRASEAAAAAKGQALAADAARARSEAMAAQQRQAQLEQEAAQARELAAKAEADRQKLRGELVRQLNLVLETRETARGLIVNMSDVLFDTGKYSLKPGAREKLAKIAGIVIAHPGLKLEVEGHTDSTGTPDFNMKLSHQRASAVRDYLVEAGVKSDSIVSRGFGQDRPVADNSTAAGRQANRRVELVVSGPNLTSSNRGVNE